MAFLESKCEYKDGERIPILPATSRRVTADSPSWRAISHAASRISRRVASRRSARLSRLGKALIVRQYADRCPHCQGTVGHQASNGASQADSEIPPASVTPRIGDYPRSAVARGRDLDGLGVDDLLDQGALGRIAGSALLLRRGDQPGALGLGEPGEQLAWSGGGAAGGDGLGGAHRPDAGAELADADHLVADRVDEELVVAAVVGDADRLASGRVRDALLDGDARKSGHRLVGGGLGGGRAAEADGRVPQDQGEVVELALCLGLRRDAGDRVARRDVLRVLAGGLIGDHLEEGLRVGGEGGEHVVGGLRRGVGVPRLPRLDGGTRRGDRRRVRGDLAVLVVRGLAAAEGDPLLAGSYPGGIDHARVAVVDGLVVDPLPGARLAGHALSREVRCSGAQYLRGQDRLLRGLAWVGAAGRRTRRGRWTRRRGLGRGDGVAGRSGGDRRGRDGGQYARGRAPTPAAAVPGRRADRRPGEHVAHEDLPVPVVAPRRQVAFCWGGEPLFQIGVLGVHRRASLLDVPDRPAIAGPATSCPGPVGSSREVLRSSRSVSLPSLARALDRRERTDRKSTRLNP